MRNAGCVLGFKRKRKITNAKIYEDKRDLYCTHGYHIFGRFLSCIRVTVNIENYVQSFSIFII